MGKRRSNRSPGALTGSAWPGLLVVALFFCSGACGLVFEVVWQRLLHLVFGGTVVATSTVLASFMGGMAAGSFYFGARADRSEQPLRLYGFQQLGIGLCGLLFPCASSGVAVIYRHVCLLTQPYSPLAGAVRMGLSVLCLAIPAALMGGTFPAAVRALVGTRGKVGRSVGLLSGANLLGAVLGCAASGFVLIPAIGLRALSWIAAGTSLALGAAALVLGKRLAPVPVEPPAPAPGHQSPERQAVTTAPTANFVLVVAGVSGACALAYEVLWTRLLAFFLRNSVYSFPTMLAVFLCGSAVGALLAALVADRLRNGLLTLGLLQGCIGLLTAGTLWLLPVVGDLTERALRAAGVGGWFAFAAPGFVPPLAVMFLPALLLGMVLPLAVKLYSRQVTRLGRSAGGVYAVNTAGAVLGSGAAAMALLPLAGVAGGIAITAGLNAIVGTVAVWYAGGQRLRPSFAVLVSLAAAVGTLASGWATWRQPVLVHSPLFRQFLEGSEHLVFYEEGREATVSVRELQPNVVDNRQHLLVEINGINVAGTPPMLRTTQKVQGHLPLLLFRAMTGREPRNVFILGFGTGESSHCISRHDIARLDCLELVPGETRANPHFAAISGDVLRNPKVHLTFGDARTFLLIARTEYDVIESDAVHPDVDITTYTREYFEICRDRLSPEGVFSAWIPLFHLSEDNLKTMMRTLCDVFPHVAVWYTPHYLNMHALLMGSKQKLRLDCARLLDGLAVPPVRESLAVVGLAEPAAILSCFMFDETALGQYLATADVNTDDRMLLPYHIPRQREVGSQTVRSNLQCLTQLQVPVRSLLTNLDALGPDAETVLERRLRFRDLLIEGVGQAQDRKYSPAIAAFLQAASAAEPDEMPHLSYLIADARLTALTRSANARIQGGAYEDAERDLRRALALKPDCARAHYLMGLLLESRGRGREALEHYAAATGAVARFEAAWLGAARAHAQLGDPTAARAACQQALQVNPHLREAREHLKTLRQP